MLALRVTYVGELGWELHVPVEFAATVYDALIAAGAPHGLVNAGYRAIESLRLEKGYRAWGAEIGPDHSPLDGGARLGGEAEDEHAVPRPGGARSAAGAAPAPPARRLHGDDRRRAARPRDDLPERRTRRLAGERRLRPHRRQGDRLRLRRRAAGVDADYVMSGDYELEVATERVPAEPFLKPLYDPAGQRVRAKAAVFQNWSPLNVLRRCHENLYPAASIQNGWFGVIGATEAARHVADEGRWCRWGLCANGSWAQRHSMRSEAVPNSNQPIRVGTDRDGAEFLLFEDAAVNGRTAEIAAIPHRRGNGSNR